MLKLSIAAWDCLVSTLCTFIIGCYLLQARWDAQQAVNLLVAQLKVQLSSESCFLALHEHR